MQKPDENWHNPSFYNSVVRWFYVKAGPLIAKKMEEKETLRNEALNSCLLLLGIKPLSKASWSVDYPNYLLKVNSTSFWKINLLTGSVRNENGVVKLSLNCPFDCMTDFKRLFGSEKFSFIETEGVYYFVTPQYGEMRIFPDAAGQKLIIIQYRSSNGEWVEYCPPKMLNELFPFGLLADYSHWIPLNKEKELLLEIRDLKTGKVRAIVDKNGSTSFIEGKETLSKLVTPNSIGLKNLLGKFEEETYQIYSSKESSHLKIDLPRYKSITGEPLSFDSNSSGKLAWNEIQKLTLSLDQEGWLGDVVNYLPLVDENQQVKKLLVPLHQMKPNRNLSSNLSLNLSEMQSDLFIGQRGCYTYMEFDVAEGKVKAQNAEGWFFLAYIYLCQKKHLKALSCLKQVKNSDPLSSESMKILFWIVNSSELVKDSSAKAAAVRLFAVANFAQKSRELPNSPMDGMVFFRKQSKKIDEVIGNELKSYVDGLNNVINLLRLPKGCETSLLNEFLLGESMINRSKFLIEGRYESERLIAKSAPQKWPLKFPKKAHAALADEMVEGKKEKKFSLIFKDQEVFYPHFPDLYRMACSGTHQDKRYVEFILNNIPRDKYIENSILFKYLKIALLKGQEAPEFANELDSSAEKIGEWLQEMDSYSNKIVLEEGFEGIEKKRELKGKEIIFPLIEPPQVNDEELLKARPPLKIQILEKFSTSKLADDYLITLKRQEKELAEQKWDIPREIQEKRYKRAVESALEEFKEEYDLGVKQNRESQEYQIAEGKDIGKLAEELKKKVKEAKELASDLEKKILSLGNKKSENEKKFLRQLSQQEGRVKGALSMPDFVRLFLRQKRQGFKLENPELSIEEIDQLYQWIGSFLAIQTQKQQMERSLAVIKKIQESKDDLTKTYLVQRLKEELSAPCTYDPSEFIECLVFEYHANIRIREKQYKLIVEMTMNNMKDNNAKGYEDLIIQLIMGGENICFGQPLDGSYL